MPDADIHHRLPRLQGDAHLLPVRVVDQVCEFHVEGLILRERDLGEVEARLVRN